MLARALVSACLCAGIWPVPTARLMRQGGVVDLVVSCWHHDCRFTQVVSTQFWHR